MRKAAEFRYRGHRWTIATASSKEIARAWGKRERVYGVCLQDDHKILIHEDGTVAEQAGTLAHELAHVIETEAGVSLPHSLAYRLDTAMKRFVKKRLGLKRDPA